MTVSDKTLFHQARELRLQHLYQQTAVTILVQIAAGLCLVLVLQPYLSRTFLIVWIALFTINLLSRVELRRRFPKHDGQIPNEGRWIASVGAMVCMSGVLWGALLFESMTLPEAIRNFSLLWVAGLVLGASSSLSAFPWMYCVFALLALGPAALSLFLLATPMAHLTLLALFVFTLYTCGNTLYMHRALMQTIGLSEKVARSEARLLERHKLIAVSQLTAGMAHNYNNLLTVIIGNVEALRPRVHPENIEFVDQAMAAALDASHLTDSLKAFSQSQALNARAVNLTETIDNFARIVTPMLGGNIVLHRKLILEDIWSIVDPAQLEISLTNIVLNAIEAMPDGGEISISLERAILTGRRASDGRDDGHNWPTDLPLGRYAQITISDTGVGMSSDTASRAFEPFFTTRNLPREGLGLSTALGFVKQTGGDMALHSQPGAGTVVTIYLPLSPDQHDQVPAVEPVVAAASSGAPVPGTIADADVLRNRNVAATSGRPQVSRC